MKGIFVLGLMVLVSCNGGGGGGSSAPRVVISKTITDSTVSNFTQISGVASIDKKWYQYIIDTAYAGTGNISCVSGEPLSISMDITLGGSTNSLLVDSTCGSNVDLDVRRKMLAALDGHQMILELAGSGSTGVNYILDFNQAEGFQFDIPYLTYEEDQTNNAVTRSCYIDYTFNSATGTVSNNTKTTALASRALQLNELSNTAMSISNPNTPTAGNGFTGCKSSSGEYRNASFRFKDGKIELDESGTNNFSINGCAQRDASENIIAYNENGDGAGNCPVGFDSTFERWCIDDNLNSICD